MKKDIFENLFEGKEFKSLVKKTAGFKKQTPTPKRQFDQFIATAETVARRAMLLDNFDDLQSKNILFLGDDDFTSLACASLEKSTQTTVVDIDQRILQNIKRISDKNNFNITALHYDATDPLPKNLLGKFDAVFTDPPYTPNGISLFLSRAIDALNKRNEDSRIYICYGSGKKAKERYLPIYEILFSSGMFIKWAFDEFNEYTGAQSIGNSSSLFILEPTPKTKPSIRDSFEGNIYTY